MRRIVIAVTIISVLAVAAGLADPASRALAAPVDAPTLLSADQTTDDGDDRFLLLFLVVALAIVVRAQGALLVSPVPQTTWLDRRVSSPRLARPPPRERAILCTSSRPATAHAR
jgi:hypothetical protein